MTTTYVKQSGKPSTFTSHTKQQIWAHINQNNMTSYSISKTHPNLGFSQNYTLISIIRPCLRQGVCFSFTNIIHQKTKNTLGFWERHPFKKKIWKSINLGNIGFRFFLKSMKHIPIAIKHKDTAYHMIVWFANPHTLFMICYLTCKTQFLLFVENILCMCANQYKTGLTRQYISVYPSTPNKQSISGLGSHLCKTQFLMFVEHVLCICANHHNIVLTKQYISVYQGTPLQNKQAHTKTCICKARHTNEFILHTSMHLHLHTSMHTLSHTHTH